MGGDGCGSEGGVEVMRFLGVFDELVRGIIDRRVAFGNYWLGGKSMLVGVTVG